MGMRRLEGADGFVVSDLDGLNRHGGIARCAPKVLADSAWLLARCATYQFASAELAVGGASVGINAAAEGRAEAVTAAVAALTDAAAGGLVLDAGKGLSDDDLAPLHAVDGSPDGYHAERSRLSGAGVAAAIEAVRPLEGSTVAIESLDPVAVALANVAVARGARIVAIGLGANGVANPDGIEASVIAEALTGSTAVTELGPAVDAAELVALDVDVLAIGSKLGAIDHTTAASVRAEVIAPTNWVPVTTRALAVLGRANTLVLPDFLALAGAVPASGLAGHVPDDALDAGTSLVGAMVRDAAAGISESWPSLVLAACARAEAFLSANGHDLPPSRPLG